MLKGAQSRYGQVLNYLERSILKMKQLQHNIEFMESSGKNPSPRWDLSSPTIRYHVVVSSLIYSLWRLVGCILICFNVTA